MGAEFRDESEVEGRGVRASTPVPPARVLVIDDEEAVARVLRRVLRGCEVTWCPSGEVACERYLEGRFAGFDVVFCDVMMPHMDGVELFERVRAGAPDAVRKLVFLTASAASSVLAELERSGVPMLPKPFDLEAVREIVRRVVAQG